MSISKMSSKKSLSMVSTLVRGQRPRGCLLVFLVCRTGYPPRLAHASAASVQVPGHCPSRSGLSTGPRIAKDLTPHRRCFCPFEATLPRSFRPELNDRGKIYIPKTHPSKIRGGLRPKRTIIVHPQARFADEVRVKTLPPQSCRRSSSARSTFHLTRVPNHRATCTRRRLAGGRGLPPSPDRPPRTGAPP